MIGGESNSSRASAQVRTSVLGRSTSQSLQEPGQVIIIQPARSHMETPDYDPLPDSRVAW
jgi:hypothetical protein